MSDSLRDFQNLLRKLFQFDAADLDFGIYRILNQKRSDIERFIQEELVEAVEGGLAALSTEQQGEAASEVERHKRELVEAVGDEAFVDGELNPAFENLLVAKKFIEAAERAQAAKASEETERHIYDDLTRFFSRYYESGDFVTKRRFASRRSKYYVPYDGEEVLLHWANRDQYYIKTSERFTDYLFTAGDDTVHFELQRADVPQDNLKAGDTRYFVLHGEDPIDYDADAGKLTVRFAFRPITEEEDDELLALYNAQQTKSKRRKTSNRSTMCVAVEQMILERVPNATLKAALALAKEDEEKTLLGTNLNRYTARNTSDYFIHKDLGGFLREQLDFYIKNEVLLLDDVLTDDTAGALKHATARARVVRTIGERIIDFLAQIEDFQKRLFEKRKFVIQTDYCVTLDQVPKALYDPILKNDRQLEAWQTLYRMDDWSEDLLYTGTIDEAFLENHPFLMIDTAHFDQPFKDELLASFENLDEAIDGLLFNSENFQALRLMEAARENAISYVYIDPPYNTVEGSFVYKNNYKDSSWICMMFDRVSVASRLMSDSGVIGVAIDDTETDVLRMILDELFGKNNFISTIAIEVNPAGQNLRPNVPARSHDYLHVYSTDAAGAQLQPRPLTTAEKDDYPELDDIGPYYWDNLRRRGGNSRPSDRPNQWYPLHARIDDQKVSIEEFDGSTEIWPIDPKGEERIWRVQQTTAKNEIQAGEISVVEKAGRLEIVKKTRMPEGKKPKTLWYDSKYSATTYGTKYLNDILGSSDFSYPKSIKLVRDCIYYWSTKDSSFLDFFAGSGTTGHAVMQLNKEDGGNRKYILVEMGEYFDTVLKPRLLKVAFASKWDNGIPQDRDGQSHVIKYHVLESYEDALNNLRIEEPEGAARELLYETFEDYRLHYMLDFETRHSPSLLAVDAFEKPFAYTLQIQRDHATPEPAVVDLEETFNYLIGLRVKQRRTYEHQNRRYVVVRGTVETESEMESTVVVWRDTEDLDHEAEAAWAAETILTEPVDRVYVNGPSHIKGAEPLEIVFRTRMDVGDNAAT